MPPGREVTQAAGAYRHPGDGTTPTRLCTPPRAQQPASETPLNPAGTHARRGPDRTLPRAGRSAYPRTECLAGKARASARKDLSPPKPARLHLRRPARPPLPAPPDAAGASHRVTHHEQFGIGTTGEGTTPTALPATHHRHPGTCPRHKGQAHVSPRRPLAPGAEPGSGREPARREAPPPRRTPPGIQPHPAG